MSEQSCHLNLERRRVPFALALPRSPLFLNHHSSLAGDPVFGSRYSCQPTPGSDHLQFTDGDGQGCVNLAALTKFGLAGMNIGGNTLMMAINLS